MKKAIAAALCLLMLLSACAGPPVPPDTRPGVTTLPPEATVPDPSVQETTLPEETEPEIVVVLPEPEDDDLVRVLDYIPLARQDLAYGTT